MGSSQLIYGYLWRDDRARSHSFEELLAMASLWAQGIRRHGNYSGDIALLTNVPSEIRIPGLATVPFDATAFPARNSRITLGWSAVPYGDYDQLLRLDLDMMAVGDVGPLFATDDRFRVAPSDLRIMDRRHAQMLVSPWKLIGYAATGRWNTLGVSSCAYSSRGRDFAAHHTILAETTARLARRAPGRGLHEQMYFNYLYLTGELQMQPYERTQVQHRDHRLTPDAAIFHYPNVSERSSKMQAAMELAGRVPVAGRSFAK